MSRRHRDHAHRRAKPRRAPGAAPGSLVVNPDSPRPQMQLVVYSPEKTHSQVILDVNTLREFVGQWPVVWLNVDGLGDGAILQQIADLFRLHPLAMEDVVNLHQRAKHEQYGDRHFIVTHMTRLCDCHLETEQLSLFLGPGFVVTFQESPGWDCLEPVRDRIRKGQPLVRKMGADYLAYCLLDAVVDHYFPVLEAVGDQLELLEDRIISTGRQSEIANVHEAKRELLMLRRLVWPLREVFNTLVREQLTGISEETRLYLRDCYDHAVRIIDLTETYREVCSDLMDLYLSTVSYRLNEVMRVLTVISSLFIPLTFVSSIYGMNFQTDKSQWNMPELTWVYGYPFFWGLITIIVIVQLVFFYRRGWIGQGDEIQATIAADAQQGSSHS